MQNKKSKSTRNNINWETLKVRKYFIQYYKITVRVYTYLHTQVINHSHNSHNRIKFAFTYAIICIKKMMYFTKTIYSFIIIYIKKSTHYIHFLFILVNNNAFQTSKMCFNFY